MPKWKHSYNGGVEIRGLKRASFQDMTIEHNKDIDDLTSERDRLAAENAELRKQVEDWKTGSTHEAHYGDDARRDLAAANATLDRLSEVFGTDKPLPFCNNCDSYQAEWQDDECISCGGNLDTSSLMLCDIYAILYPTPENENEQ